MKRWILILVFLGLPAAAAYHWRFNLRDPAKLSGNTCEGRDFCVSVYMAPWCPHCKTALPQVQKMLAASTDVRKPGVRVVIGMGQGTQSQEMAARIAKDGVLIDDDTRIAKKLNVTGVPSFKILDKEGDVIVDGQEAYEWINEKFGG